MHRLLPANRSFNVAQVCMHTIWGGPVLWMIGPVSLKPPQQSPGVTKNQHHQQVVRCSNLASQTGYHVGSGRDKLSELQRTQASPPMKTNLEHTFGGYYSMLTITSGLATHTSSNTSVTHLSQCETEVMSEWKLSSHSAIPETEPQAIQAPAVGMLSGY